MLFKELTVHICPQNPRLEHAQAFGGRFELATLYFKVLKLLSQYKVTGTNLVLLNLKKRYNTSKDKGCLIFSPIHKFGMHGMRYGMLKGEEMPFWECSLVAEAQFRAKI